MLQIESTLFNDIYRPVKLDDYIGNKNFKEHMKEWIEKNDLPHMLLSGPAGVGKTTAAKLLVKNIDCDWIFINASDERGIETIREKVVHFAATSTFAPIKIIILDEADYLSHLSQPALRGIIEQFSSSTRFILTCNYSDKIIPALKSRCPEFVLQPASKSEIAQRIDYILQQENIEYDVKDLVTIINRYYPDLRNILNIVQICCKNGKLVLNLDNYSTDNVYDDIINYLKSKKNDNSYRQLIINSNQTDYTGLYKTLFDKLNDWCDEQYQTEILILLNNYMYQSYFVPDKELNISACIANIKQIIN